MEYAVSVEEPSEETGDPSLHDEFYTPAWLESMTDASARDGVKYSCCRIQYDKAAADFKAEDLNEGTIVLISVWERCVVKITVAFSGRVPQEHFQAARDRNGMRPEQYFRDGQLELNAKFVAGVWEAQLKLLSQHLPAEAACAVCVLSGEYTEATSRSKVCAGCKLVRYCSADCQKLAWKGHKSVCKAGGLIEHTWVVQETAAFPGNSVRYL